MEPINQQPEPHTVFKPVEPPHKDFLHRHQVAGYIFVGTIVALAVLFNYKMQIYREMMNTDFPAHQKALQVQSSNQMADWNTYSNLKEGFELKYPKNLYAFSSPSPGKFIIYDQNVKPNYLATNFENIKVTITSFISAPYSKDDFEYYLEPLSNPILSSEDINISGKVAYRFNLTGPSEEELRDPYGTAANVFVGIPFSDGDGLTIELESRNHKDTLEYKKDLEVFNQILSTFKVIEPGAGSSFIIPFKVGDNVGAMKVVSIEPFSATRPDSINADNYRVKFSGQVTVTGSYTVYLEEGPGCGFTFMPDSQSEALMPKIIGDDRRYFCPHVLNENLLPENFFKEDRGGIATIVIDNYEIIGCGCEGQNKADLIEVIKLN